MGSASCWIARCRKFGQEVRSEVDQGVGEYLRLQASLGSSAVPSCSFLPRGKPASQKALLGLATRPGVAGSHPRRMNASAFRGRVLSCESVTEEADYPIVFALPGRNSKGSGQWVGKSSSMPPAVADSMSDRALRRMRVWVAMSPAAPKLLPIGWFTNNALGGFTKLMRSLPVATQTVAIPCSSTILLTRPTVW